MEKLEKKVLKTVCENLKNVTIRPNITKVEDYETWIKMLRQSILESINMIATLMDGDGEENEQKSLRP